VAVDLTKMQSPKRDRDEVSEEGNKDVTLSLATKKIKLSEDEMSLNGAPEGELFEVSVIPDEDLEPLLNSSVDFGNSLILLRSNVTLWGEKHVGIEILRRACMFHKELINLINIGEVIKSGIDAAGSLRSSISRNGILCLKAIFEHSAFSDWISESTVDILREAINILMNRSCTGPKFICVTASKALEIGVNRTPIIYLNSLLIEFTSHRNAEISSRSYTLFANRICADTLPNISDSKNSFCDTLLFLEKGLKSARPQSREASRKSLVTIIETLGREVYEEKVQEAFPDDRKKPLLMLLEKAKSLRVVPLEGKMRNSGRPFVGGKLRRTKGVERDVEERIIGGEDVSLIL
jgi:hypothetical protein